MNNLKADVYVTCGNSFYKHYFEKVCGLLEEGKVVEIYIDCIGHTRNNMTQDWYKEELEKKYGALLTVQYNDGYCSYSYTYKLNKAV